MLKLYYSPGACALASHIALEEAGAAYEAVAIDLKKGEQKAPDYLAINPAGVTPALMTEHGVITENSAIMPYVAALHPQAGLTPTDDAFAFARMQAVNGFLGASLHPAIGRALFSRPPLEGEARDQAIQAALAKYDLAENHMLQGPYVLGDAYSVSDGYMVVFSRWARQAGLLDKGRFPKLNAHLDLVQARDAVQRVLKAEGISTV